MKKTILVLFILMAGSLGAAAGPTTNIELQEIRTEPVPLQTAEYADIWFRVTNTGSTAAQDVNVSFEPSFPFSVDPDERTTWDIGELPANMPYYIHMQVKVDENAVYGQNDLEFRVSTGSGTAIGHAIPVEVRADDAVLAVDEIRFPAQIAAGQQERMTLQLHNYADSHLNNIEVSVDPEGLPVATAGTTRNTVDSLAPGESASTSFQMMVDQDADNGVQKLPITLSYENEAGTAFEKETTTGVVIGGDPQLELGLNQRDLQVAGSTGTVTLRIVNRGDGTARFVKLDMLQQDGVELLSPDSIYLGNMDPDDYQTAEFRLHADSSVEEVRLRGNLSYRASGETLDEVQSTPINLYGQSEAQQYGLVGNGSSLPLIGVALIVIVGGVVYWRRRR